MNYLASFILTFLCISFAQDTFSACPPSLDLTSFASRFGNPTTKVTIPSGSSILLDSDLDLSQGITVEQGAKLYFSWTKDLNIKAQSIIVLGEMYIGTEDCPIENKIDIQLHGSAEATINGRSVGKRVIATGPGATIEIHGAKGASKSKSWTQLARTAQKGSTYIQLVDEVANDDASSWKAGDKLVITSTDFSPMQTEEVTIKSVVNSTTVELTAPINFMHFGEITFGVDERAEVGLLTRNIKIHGTNTVNFGAHLMVGPNTANAKIEGAEFTDVGQDQIARYPVHFHLAGKTEGWYAKYNSIHGSYFRCITVHATQGLLIESNVGYDILGHCYYLEDGVETNNTFIGNLAVMVKPKATGERIGSDRIEGISAFWITNPGNSFIDNVAAAGYGAGYWFHGRLGPRGVAKDMGTYNNVVPARTPLIEFRGNRAHGLEDGIQIEATYFDGNDNPQVSNSPPATYAPRDSEGKQVPTYLDNYSAYKIRFRGIWARVEDLILRNASFADCYEAVQIATSGAHPPAPSVQVVEDSIFVGLSGNKGTLETSSTFQGWEGNLGASYPLRGEGLTGWKVYDGTQGIRNSKFINYPAPSGGKYHAAIGIRSYNHAQVSSTNFADNLTFVNVSRRVYLIDKSGDGGIQANFRDNNGSVSGYKNSHILQDMGFYRTEKCVAPEGDNWISCPHKYNQMWVLDMARSNADQNNMKITRNNHVGTEHTKHQLSYQGFADSGVWRYQPIVSVNASYLVEFKKYVSNKLAFQMVNGQKDESVELVVCYPKGSSVVQINLGAANKDGAGGIPNKGSSSSLEAASSKDSAAYKDGTAYYYDSSRSLLYLNLKQTRERGKYGHFCPWGGCDFIWAEMRVSGGSRDCSSEVYSGSNSIQKSSGRWIEQDFE